MIFIKNRDLQSAKEAYARYRDLVRQKTEMFQYAAPEEYAKGRVAGAGTTMGVGLGATQGLNLARNASTAKQILTGAGTGAALASAPAFGEGEGGFYEPFKKCWSCKSIYRSCCWRWCSNCWQGF